MQFTPKTEKEIEESRLLPAGEYPFEVISAEEKLSKKGNPMIELQLRVFKPDGGTMLCRDWLLDSIEYKLRHFADATGLLKEYGLGELQAQQCEGRSGTLKLDVQKQEGYPDRNAVKDYVKASVGLGRPAAVPAAGMPDDADIPF